VSPTAELIDWVADGRELGWLRRANRCAAPELRLGESRTEWRSDPVSLASDACPDLLIMRAPRSVGPALETDLQVVRDAGWQQYSPFHLRWKDGTPT